MTEGYFQAPEPQGAAGQVILRDGRVATLRPATLGDRVLLLEFLARIGRESYHRRFFAETPPEVAAARMLALGPPEHKLVLFVLTGDSAQPRLIPTGEYVREAPLSDRAEVAFLVDDTAQGRGLGTLLLERLALVAARHGVSRFTALTAARNRAMLNMFSGSGFKVEQRLESGEVELNFSILPSRESVARMELHERVSTVASLYPFFKPRTVAVLGLSTPPESASQRVLRHLQAGGFAGRSYLVNPNLAGAHPSLAALPERAELAILALPQSAVLEAVGACGQAGVRALIVISAGFAESGMIAAALQAEVAQQVQAYGMRLVGPNSLGLLSAGAAVRLNASLAPDLPAALSPVGGVAVSSQSGALALAILKHAAAAGLGLSSLVSLGNKADVSSNDLLQYWEDDPEVRLIVLYLATWPRSATRAALPGWRAGWGAKSPFWW
jgi:GNAT superfamily N-acetyltransferase/predicted CoA-binding protein